MSRQDAVAVALGVRPGEVVEITRPSRTSITGGILSLVYIVHV